MGTRKAWTISALLLATSAPLGAQVDTTGAEAEAAVRPEGYPVPSLESYRRVEDRVANLDAVSFVPGAETLAEPFEGPGGERIMRFTTGGVVWGYTLMLTPGDMTSVYFLRDPTCNGVFTEKLKPGDPFGPPVCAAESARAQAEGAAVTPSPGADSAGVAADPESGQAADAPEGDPPACVGLGCGDSVPVCVGMGCPQ